MRRAGRINRLGLAVGAVLVALLAVVVVMYATRPSPPREFIESLTTSADQLTLLALSPDGRIVAAGSADGSVATVRLAGKRAELIDSEGLAPLTMLTFARDGLLMSGDRDGQLRAWQAPDFEAIEFDEALQTSVAITAAAFRRNGGSLQIILGLGDGRLALIGEEGTQVRESGHRGLKVLALTKDDATLISAGCEGKVFWHDLETEKSVRALEEHQTDVGAIALSPNGDRMASADWNGLICVTDMATRNVLAKHLQDDAVSDLAWAADDRVVTGSWDGYIRVWSVSDAAMSLEEEFDTGNPVHALLVAPSGDRILTVSNGNSIDVWQLAIEALSSPD